MSSDDGSPSLMHRACLSAEFWYIIGRYCLLL